MIGQLAGNAGQFATGQAVNQQNLQWSQFGLGQAQLYAQEAARQQQAQLEQQRIDQQAQMQQAGFSHEDAQNAIRQKFQQDINDRDFQHRQALMERQYGLQGQNQQDLADLNNQYRQGLADQRDQTTRYGIDQRTGLGYDRMDASTQQAQDRLEAMKQHWSDAMANGNQGQSLALRQQMENRIASNQTLARQNQMHQFDLRELDRQMSRVQQQLSGPQGLMLPPDQQQQLRTTLNALQDQYNRKSQEYRNFMLGTLAPDPNAGGVGYQGQGVPDVPGLYAGDQIQSVPMAGGGGMQPQQQMPAMAQQPSDVFAGTNEEATPRITMVRRGDNYDPNETMMRAHQIAQDLVQQGVTDRATFIQALYGQLAAEGYDPDALSVGQP
jgi:hypothetical protein